jgi:hypothetical protein
VLMASLDGTWLATANLPRWTSLYSLRSAHGKHRHQQFLYSVLIHTLAMAVLFVHMGVCLLCHWLAMDDIPVAAGTCLPAVA